MSSTAPMKQLIETEFGFDPDNWDEFGALLHQAVDDMVDYLRTIAERPAYQPVPDTTKALLSQGLPEHGQGLASVYQEVLEHVMPFPTGNIHPRFWSWVGGTGTPHGVLADLVISTMNSTNLGFDDAATTYLELQLLDWLKEMFGFPEDASGLLVSGGSMANLVGLAVARNAQADYDLRTAGVEPLENLRFYASSETHSSVRKAIELLGLGRNALITIPVREDFAVDMVLLDERIRVDRARGLRPVAVIGNAGTVNTGAMDPLDALANLCQRHELWLHVDGAFGALAAISSLSNETVRGLDRADSLGFDLHKWMYQQYDIGCVLIRNRQVHQDTFNVQPDYLRKAELGLASGPTDFSALGVQLSRSAKALRAWMTIKAEGLGKFRTLVDQNIRQARYLSGRIDAEPELERLAPTALNIVNFRFRPSGWDAVELDTLNEEILTALHTRGIATPSSTQIRNRFSIRVAICNHRSRLADFDALVDGVLQIGRERVRAAT